MDDMISIYDKKMNDLFYENYQRSSQHLASLSCQKIQDTDIKELSGEIYQDHTLSDVSLDMENMKILQYDSIYMKAGLPIREGKGPINEYGSVHPMDSKDDEWVTYIFSFHDSMERLKKDFRICKDVMDLYPDNLAKDVIKHHEYLAKDVKNMIGNPRNGRTDLEQRVESRSAELNMK